MILNGCVAMKPGPCKAINYSNMSYFSHDRAFSASPKVKNLCAASQEFDPLPSRGMCIHLVYIDLGFAFFFLNICIRH